MRMSCNGCRVLRKGCSDDCTIRPCLQWIKSPEAQANATVFLAKFYGRAGLLNLINAGPDHLRPAIFRSLLYEACGRIVNPIYGSVGLLWSGSWRLCQQAVDSVLAGSPIIPIPSEAAAAAAAPPLKSYDIRHVAKPSGAGSGSGAEPLKVNKSRAKFKRAGAKPRLALPARAASRDSEPSRDGNESGSEGTSAEAGSHVSQGEPSRAEESEVELELTLGFEPSHNKPSVSRGCDLSLLANEASRPDLALQLTVM